MLMIKARTSRAALAIRMQGSCAHASTAALCSPYTSRRTNAILELRSEKMSRN